MDPVQEGVGNLVNNCAKVKPGESVLLINERGEADTDVVELIADDPKIVEAARVYGIEDW